MVSAMVYFQESAHDAAILWKLTAQTITLWNKFSLKWHVLPKKKNKVLQLIT